MEYTDKYKKYKTNYLLLGGANKLNNKTINKYKTRTKYKINRTMETKYKHNEHLSEPWFSLISLGLKTVEGRLNKGKFKEMQIGDIIEFHNNDFLERKILTKIIEKIEYKSFTEYLETEGLDKCLPGVPSLEHGLSVYYKYYSKEKEKEFGIIAIRIELV